MIYRFTPDKKFPETSMPRYRTLLLAAIFVLPAACSYKPSFINEYRIDVQQGNVLTQEMVAQLKPGQTREQVRFILGTPLIADVFHADRWDYVYRFRDGDSGKVSSRRFSVFFGADGLLQRVSGDVDVATVAELTTPVERTRVVDLGVISAEAADAPTAPPEEPGFFRRMIKKIGF